MKSERGMGMLCRRVHSKQRVYPGKLFIRPSTFHSDSVGELKMYRLFLTLSAVCAFLLSEEAQGREILVTAKAIVRSLYQQSNSEFESMLESLQHIIEDEDVEFGDRYAAVTVSSHLCYRRARAMDTQQERLELHQRGKDLAELGIEMMPYWSDCAYLAGLHLGRYSDELRDLSCIGNIQKVQAFMKQACDNESLTDEPGESIEGQGPDRVLGYAYWKMHFAIGGSRVYAKHHLKRAFDLAPEHALNQAIYGAFLIDGPPEERPEGIEILKHFLAQPDEHFGKDAAEDIKEARAIAQKALDRFV
jgi:hypothetical protein